MCAAELQAIHINFLADRPPSSNNMKDGQIQNEIQYKPAMMVCWVGILFWTPSKLPQLEQTLAKWVSEQFINLSCKQKETPWLSNESLSISPNLMPPCFFRPLTGCRVTAITGPVDLTWLLSLTMCLSITRNKNKMNSINVMSYPIVSNYLP